MMRSKVFVVIGILGLIVVYVFQNHIFYDPFADFLFNPADPKTPDYSVTKYIAFKALRYLLNDGFALMIIWGLFKNQRYVRFAVIVFFIGFLVFLPFYLVLSISYYQETVSFLNHLHRLILNPVLMMLLIPAFYYQQSLNKGKPKG